jgi:hypothetical protein
LHAPLALQSLVPHTPVVVHVVALAQQWVPVPDTPHSLLVHWSLALQLAPVPPMPTHVPVEPGFLQ